jgi:hypothetical protein
MRADGLLWNTAAIAWRGGRMHMVSSELAHAAMAAARHG